MISAEVRMLEPILSNLVRTGVSLKALNLIGFDNVVNRDPDFYSRNLKRGGTWFVAKNLADEILTMDSDLRKLNTLQGVSIAFVDTVSNAVVSGVLERTNIPRVVGSVFSNFVSGELLELLTTSVLVTGGLTASEALIKQVGIDKINFSFF